jgi:hypothetical protein
VSDDATALESIPEQPHRPPVSTYHEAMPTDAAGFEEALIREEIRTGEDGELTTDVTDENPEPSA